MEMIDNVSTNIATIRWQDSNPASNLAGKQVSCAAGFKPISNQ